MVGISSLAEEILASQDELGSVALETSHNFFQQSGLLCLRDNVNKQWVTEVISLNHDNPATFTNVSQGLYTFSSSTQGSIRGSHAPTLSL